MLTKWLPSGEDVVSERSLEEELPMHREKTKM